ncbi:MAG: HlyC/CorC family transporter [Solirubrobacterales bacterium]|nr:HlyC/CorC family transporter [Solirubrobacterales bacterium]
MSALALVLTALLVLVNAFFVIAEYALVRSRESRLETIVEERARGARGARVALAQMDAMGDYIAACQVGITMASIGIGALGEPAIADLLKQIFGKAPSGAVAAIAGVVAYVIITFFQSTVGEIVPKLYTLQHAEGMVVRVAPVMRVFILVFKPVIVALNVTSEWMVRALGTDPHAESDQGTPDDIKALIASSHSGGQIDRGEAEMLTGVFHLHEQEARQVMTPIPAVVTVDISATVGEGLETCVRTGHSRLVVVEDDDEDQVRGIVHVNQLVKVMLQRGAEARFEDRVRAAPIVPETKPLDDLLGDLQRERTELAVVVDEYGRTAGIVTIEDIIEEVVGEISDETDPHGSGVRQLANGDWFIRGHVPVADLDNYGLDLPVDTDAYNSIGGFVFAELGRLPKRGDQIDANGHNIRVEAVRQNRVEAVRVRKVKRREPDGEQAD